MAESIAGFFFLIIFAVLYSVWEELVSTQIKMLLLSFIIGFVLGMLFQRVLGMVNLLNDTKSALLEDMLKNIKDK